MSLAPIPSVRGLRNVGVLQVSVVRILGSQVLQTGCGIGTYPDIHSFLCGSMLVT